MSKWFMWFQKDNVAELEKDKAKLLERKAELEAEIKAIDEKIVEIKSKNKDKH